MRWPWRRKTEDRSGGGDLSDAVIRWALDRAAGVAQDATTTAAVEAASGALARSLASARVKGPARVQSAVSPLYLAQVGRDLIRTGESMHLIDVSSTGATTLLPVSSWHFRGGAHPDTWSVQTTTYGPDTSTTKTVPFAGVVFVRWGSTPGQPYIGSGPLAWASTSARMMAETDRSLADEAGGPIAQLLAIPQDPGEGDNLDSLRDDLGGARGKAVLVETTAAGWGAGPGGAPQRDWAGVRLGPNPPAPLVSLRGEAFASVLAACGTPPGMFLGDADGTAQREALRRYYLGTVIPLARIMELELSAKLEAPVALDFDLYPLDLAGRAQAFQKLVAGGVEIPEALAVSGLLTED